jgi:hypothetical protein
VRALLAAVLVLVPAQSEADKLAAALKKFGDRSYLIMENGKKVGTYTLKTRIAVEEGRRLAVFEDRIDKHSDSSTVTLDLVEKATLNGLRLDWATRADGGMKEDDTTIDIQDGDGHVATDLGNLLLKKVGGAVGERALIRLVCAQEQKVGNSFKADLLVLDPVDYQRGQEIKCVARETIDVGGKKIEAHKWEDKREGESVLNGKPIAYKFDNAYWVGPDGTLVKFRSGSMEMILEPK